MDTALLKNGLYAIKKTEKNGVQLNKIKEELTVKPISDYFVKSFQLYKETNNFLLVPPYYGLNKFGKPPIDNRSLGQDISISFKGKLRDYQKEAIEKVLVSFKNNIHGGILKVSCGGGKTLMAINIICQMGKKALIIVNQDYLCDYWQREIKRFTNTLKISILSRTENLRETIQNNDILISVVNSIAFNDEKFSRDLFNEIQLVIFDESHVYATEGFSKCLFKTSCKYMLGLSATPNRDDGLGKIIQWFIGPVLYEYKGSYSGETPIVNIIRYKSPDETYTQSTINENTGKLNYTPMLQNLCENPDRNILIIKMIKSLVNQGRKILVISSRRSHLEYLKEILDKLDIISGIYYGAKNKKEKEELDEAIKCQVILGIRSMTSQSFNVPEIDTLIMTTSFKPSKQVNSNKMDQVIGRVLRQSHVINPLIIDIVDQFSVFKSHGYMRQRYYKEQSYIMNYVNIEKEEDFKIKMLLTTQEDDVEKEEKKKIIYEYESD